jgi:hypothetical protein
MQESSRKVISMARCKIKKYDELPAVVGGIDVDVLRFHLWNINQKRDRIIVLLEQAVKIKSQSLKNRCDAKNGAGSGCLGRMPRRYRWLPAWW